MSTLSAVIITRNEERNIGRCLESIRNVADEIIVVDSFSTDATAQICARYKTLFTRRHFDGYASQKNFANSLATCEYILSLDADESLSDKLKKNILDFKKKPVADLVEMKRRTNYCGQWIRFSGWYPDKKIRLWKKGKARWGGPLVHEVLITEPDATMHAFNADILHYSYYTFKEHKDRAHYYAGLAAKAVAEENKRVGLGTIWTKTIAKFLRNYIILLGFLDGKNGFRIGYVNALETFLKYKEARMLYKQKTRSV